MHSSVSKARARSLSTAFLLWIGAMLGACVKDEPSCVSLGSGWRACAPEMAVVDAGPPVFIDSSVPPAARDAATVTASSSGAAASGVGGGTPAVPKGDGGASGISAGSAANVAGASGVGRGLSGSGAGRGVAGSAGAASSAGIASGGAGAGAVGGSGVGGAGAGGVSSCCGALGRCVTRSEVVSSQAALFSKDTCQNDGALCAPSALSGNAASVPKTCHSVLDAEGRCLPDCLSNLALQAGRLPKDVCAEHELCAACFDPVSGDATGYCAFSGDPGPREAPRVFPSCCDSQTDAQAVCVPQSFVPEGVVMPRATCDAESLCVPRAWASDPSVKPSYCTDDVRGRGVCVPQCLANALGALVTGPADCLSDNQCYPCSYVGGLPTGLCSGT